MAKLYYIVIRLLKDDRGQDLIEYALLAAIIAVSAGFLFPNAIEPSISGIFSKVVSCFNNTP